MYAEPCRIILGDEQASFGDRYLPVHGHRGIDSLHELGPDRYARALADHRARLREAFAHHGGVEVDTQGDAFFVAFPTAPGRSPHRALSTVGETSHCAAPLR
jgi:hypothetical protein